MNNGNNHSIKAGSRKIIASGMGVGVALGAAIGAAMGHIALGLAIGMIVGGIGVAIQRRKQP